MKMRIERKDIYNIQIDDIDTGNFNGCPEGYDDFDVDIDDITQDGDIKIEISGTCKCFSYHDSMPCTFEGTLIMDESEFTSAYTYLQKMMINILSLMVILKYHIHQEKE